MASTLRLYLHPPFIPTTSLRPSIPLLPPSLPPHLVGKFDSEPRTLSVSKISRITASTRFNQGVGDGGNRLPNSNWRTVLSKFAVDNFLPLVLVSGVVIGFANPRLGCLADKYGLSKLSTFGIFIITGITLRSDEIGAATEAWPVGLFGLASILFFSPFFSKIIMLLELQPQEFVTGLAIFSCMPTSISSGVALTRVAGGNSALALGMTAISGLLGILIIPFSVSKLVAAGSGIPFPTEQLLRSLTVTLLVPLILGKDIWC